MRTPAFVAAALASLVVSGCASYRYARTTQATAAAKSATCTFDVLTTRPERSFDELGIIDFYGHPNGASRYVGDFTLQVRPFVCQAGGDAVLAEVNGMGQYIRGTVIAFKPATSSL